MRSDITTMVSVKRNSVRTSVVVLGACLAYACAGGGGSELEGGEWAGGELSESGFDEEGNPLAVDELADNEGGDSENEAVVSEELASAEEEGLELGTLGQALGGSCGSDDSTTINSVFYYTAVPDHFPPDSIAAQLALSALGIPLSASVGCAAFGLADMHSTCDQHDACYGERGQSKSDCDDRARSSWRRACENEYDSISGGDVALGFLTGGFTAPAAIAEQACREACLGQAQAMYLAISAAGQSAYDIAQEEASRPQVTPQGPIFF